MVALFLSFLPCKSFSRELQIRGAYQFGVIGRMEQSHLSVAFKKMILVMPEANVAYQFSGRWFLSGSYTYARLRDKPGRNNLGVLESGHMNVFGPSMGFKFFSAVGEPQGGGDFFDNARWWSNIEFGPYVTAVRSPRIGKNTDTDFAFNFGAGFDYYVNKTWALGIQTKFHYVNYSPDDYILYSFGPHVVARFF